MAGARLEHSLVLARYFGELLGAASFEELRASLRDLPEGPGPDGHSLFFHALSGWVSPVLQGGTLAYYDSRIIAYEALLAHTRRTGAFRHFKYFQYLALLYTEIFFDRLTEDPEDFRRELNAFRASKGDFAGIPPFVSADLRRLAFFLATGSGKTLLLQANIWQLFYYLENGRHPEALVSRADHRREFDNVLLITPSEGLSAQHLAEFADSGIAAARFERGSARTAGGSSANATGAPRIPTVQVIEIHKLTEDGEEATSGVSVPLRAFGGRNLVIVDEGHKGTGSEAQAWKSRQKTLSEDGFLLEYSATFAQAIGAAVGAAQASLLAEYGKAIAFDYSYRYFYGDGYGKAFRVLNLRKATPETAHELILGGLLIFYQQSRLYADPVHALELRPYGIDAPLWVLLGTSVSHASPAQADTSAPAAEERTDVAQVVAFLRRFLEDPDWAISHIGAILAGRSGFAEADALPSELPTGPGPMPKIGRDLFAEPLRFLITEAAKAKENSKAIYRDICKTLFHGRGGLEVVEIKRSGEIGLRVSAGTLRESPYFALINIGDVAAFRRHLETTLGLTVREDVMSEGLFGKLDRRSSPINMLIGAKKFIEGWSSWRVSSLGLLRIGKGEGAQVIQLFGRGVRLRGRDASLRRSMGEPLTPPYLESLETLFVVSWNADYLATFSEMLAREGVDKELTPLRVVPAPIPPWALVPQVAGDFEAASETWELDASGPPVALDLVAQIVSLTSGEGDTARAVGAAGEALLVRFGGGAGAEPPAGRRSKAVDETDCADLLDFDELYLDLLAYKGLKGYGNVFISRAELREILCSRAEVRLLATDARDPAALTHAASQALKAYLDHFVAYKEREAQGRHLDLTAVAHGRGLPGVYHIRVHAEGAGEELLVQLESALAAPTAELLGEAAGALPRLHLDYHLFNPLLIVGDADWQSHVAVNPPALNRAQERLARDICDFWREHKDAPAFAGTELCFLRSLPQSATGLFARSSFFPDFILWIANRKAGALRIVFLDPRGLPAETTRGDLARNEQFAAIGKLRAADWGRPGEEYSQIAVDGYIVVPAGESLEIFAAEPDLTWADLEAQFPLAYQDETGDYIGKILRSPTNS